MTGWGGSSTLLGVRLHLIETEMDTIVEMLYGAGHKVAVCSASITKEGARGSCHNLTHSSHWASSLNGKLKDRQISLRSLSLLEGLHFSIA